MLTHSYAPDKDDLVADPFLLLQFHAPQHMCVIPPACFNPQLRPRRGRPGGGLLHVAVVPCNPARVYYPSCVLLTHSYAPDEDDLVVDPFLAQHLAHWGIDIMQVGVAPGLYVLASTRRQRMLRPVDRTHWHLTWSVPDMIGPCLELPPCAKSASVMCLPSHVHPVC